MRSPRISQSQLELLATRLTAVGVGRRDFLRIAGGVAAMGAASFNARSAAAAPKLAPGEKLAREQDLRFGGGSWFQNDPTSQDLKTDLYFADVPVLFAGLMKVNVNFAAIPY